MTVLISADVEASGDCPGLGDLASFALVVIEPGLRRTFESGLMRPECKTYRESAYMFGVTRAQHEQAEYSIAERMRAMDDWIKTIYSPNGRYVMVSDNPGFDFMWLSYECHHNLGYSPFGHSARRIGDVYAGLRNRPRDTSGWKKLRKSPHDHNPLNDALGNAEAWLAMWAKYGTTKESGLAGIPKEKWDNARDLKEYLCKYLSMGEEKYAYVMGSDEEDAKTVVLARCPHAQSIRIEEA